MIDSILGTLMEKSLGSSAQSLETGRSVVDQTFKDVFSSITETERMRATDRTDRKDREQATRRNERAETRDDNREREPKETVPVTPTEPVRESRTEETQNQNNENKEVKPNDGEETSLSENSEPVEETTKGATEEETSLQELKKTIMDKLKEMLDADPSKLKDLLADMKEMSSKDFLSALGFSSDEIAKLSKAIEKLAKMMDLSEKLSGKIPELANVNAILELLKMGKGKGHLKEEMMALLEKLNNKPKTEAETSLVDPMKRILETVDKKSRKKKGIIMAQTSSKADAKHAAPTAKEIVEAIATNAKQANNAVKGDVPKGATQTAAKQPDISLAGETARKAESSEPTTKPARSSTRSAFERAIMNQVVEKARINIRPNGNSNMTIKLDPPNLGKVDMRIVVQDNMVRAVMIADNREVRGVIESNLENLKASLSAAGLKVDEITVSTADDGNRFRNENLAQDRQDGNGSQNSGHANQGNGVGNDDDTISANAGNRRIHNGALDVVA